MKNICTRFKQHILGNPHFSPCVSLCLCRYLIKHNKSYLTYTNPKYLLLKSVRNAVRLSKWLLIEWILAELLLLMLSINTSFIDYKTKLILILTFISSSPLPIPPPTSPAPGTYTCLQTAPVSVALLGALHSAKDVAPRRRGPSVVDSWLRTLCGTLTRRASTRVTVLTLQCMLRRCRRLDPYLLVRTWGPVRCPCL